MSQKKSNYQDNYLDFGFTYIIQDGIQIPQCVLCMKTFSNSTMKSAPPKKTPGKFSSKYDKQRKVLFWLKTVPSKKTKAGQNWNFLED